MVHALARIAHAGTPSPTCALYTANRTQDKSKVYESMWPMLLHPTAPTSCTCQDPTITPLAQTMRMLHRRPKMLAPLSPPRSPARRAHLPRLRFSPEYRGTATPGAVLPLTRSARSERAPRVPRRRARAPRRRVHATRPPRRPTVLAAAASARRAHPRPCRARRAARARRACPAAAGGRGRSGQSAAVGAAAAAAAAAGCEWRMELERGAAHPVLLLVVAHVDEDVVERLEPRAAHQQVEKKRVVLLVVAARHLPPRTHAARETRRGGYGGAAAGRGAVGFRPRRGWLQDRGSVGFRTEALGALGPHAARGGGGPRAIRWGAGRRHLWHGQLPQLVGALREEGVVRVVGVVLDQLRQVVRRARRERVDGDHVPVVADGHRVRERAVHGARVASERLHDEEVVELVVGLGVVHTHPLRHRAVARAQRLAQVQHREIRKVRHARHCLEHVEARKVVACAPNASGAARRTVARVCNPVCPTPPHAHPCLAATATAGAFRGAPL
eukprot:5112978-Prymnesium_polylepis.1